MSVVYVNGEFVPEGKAAISVFDSCFLYGDGVFEGIRAYNGRVFRLEEHVDRLYDSAQAIMLKIPTTKEKMCDIVARTCRENNLKDCYIRLVVTRGSGNMGLNPFTKSNPSIVCVATQIELYPEEFVNKGLKVVTAATRRTYGEILPPQVKSCNYLPNIMARIEAVNAGAQEAICMTREGYVAECTGDNIFFVKGGVIQTPDPGVGILLGITRKAIFDIADANDIPVKESFLTRFDVYTADEIFVSGTAAEIVPVREVDGRIIGEGTIGPVTKRIREQYQKLVSSEGYPIF